MTFRCANCRPNLEFITFWVDGREWIATFTDFSERLASMSPQVPPVPGHGGAALLGAARFLGHGDKHARSATSSRAASG
jgi:hypothetical protein